MNRGWRSWICRLPAVQAAGICTFRPDLWDLEAPGRFELPVEVLQPSTCPSKQARNREFIALFYRLGPPESAGIRPKRVALRVALASSSIRSAAVGRSPIAHNAEQPCTSGWPSGVRAGGHDWCPLAGSSRGSFIVSGGASRSFRNHGETPASRPGALSAFLTTSESPWMSGSDFRPWFEELKRRVPTK